MCKDTTYKNYNNAYFIIAVKSKWQLLLKKDKEWALKCNLYNTQKGDAEKKGDVNKPL